MRAITAQIEFRTETYGFVYISENVRVGWALWGSREESGGRPDLFAGGSNWHTPQPRDYVKAANALRACGVMTARELVTPDGVLSWKEGNYGSYGFRQH